MTHPHIIRANQAITTLQRILRVKNVNRYRVLDRKLNKLDSWVAKHGPYEGIFPELAALSALVRQINEKNKAEMSRRVASKIDLLLGRQIKHSKSVANSEMKSEEFEEEVLRALERHEKGA